MTKRFGSSKSSPTVKRNRAERTEAESHLESCEDCRSHYQFVRALESASESHRLAGAARSVLAALPSKVLARLERDRARPELLAEPLCRRRCFASAPWRQRSPSSSAVGFSVLRDDQLQLGSERMAQATEPARASAPVDEKATGVSGQPGQCRAGVSPQADAPRRAVGRGPSVHRAGWRRRRVVESSRLVVCTLLRRAESLEESSTVASSAATDAPRRRRPAGETRRRAPRTRRKR